MTFDEWWKQDINLGYGSYEDFAREAYEAGQNDTQTKTLTDEEIWAILANVVLNRKGNMLDFAREIERRLK